ncbi:hypothetical protein Sjap_000290 [Stephania japonica]|uniref:Uncharacterized protein n=1 Tax=Stephania japonica TaxID=461633 RepID=A0AAP0KIQ1_9MAGN
MLAVPQPLDHASIMNPLEKIDDDHMGNIGESIFKNYIDYDFSDLENLPDFGDCDLSLYDDLMRNITDDNDSGGGDGVLK